LRSINRTGSLFVFSVPRQLKIEDVKPLIGNLSRSNYYQVEFGGLSSGLRGYLGQRGVDNSFITEDSGLLCYGAQLPGSSLAGIESTNFTGITETMAHRRIYTSLSLEFYCDNRYRSLKFFEHWMEYAASGNGFGNYADSNYTYRMNYPNDSSTGYKCNSTKIYKFESDVERLMEYSFLGLFPINLSSTPVRYGPNSELTRVTCEFRYDRYIAGSILSYDVVRGFGYNLGSGLTNVVQDGLENAFPGLNRNLTGITDTINRISGPVSDVLNLFTN